MEDTIDQKIRAGIERIHKSAPGTIGDLLKYELVSVDEEKRVFCFRCQTEPWMSNVLGTLHGGIIATIIDQAMGFVTFANLPGPGIAPTIQMQESYHHFLYAGAPVLIKVYLVSVSKSLITSRAEVFAESNPDQLCATGSGTYYFLQAK